jgi:SAM-dependent methyltransferase
MAFVSPGEQVVELGCGTGVPVGKLLSAKYDYTGVDSSAGMLARARSALPDANLIHADMHAVAFPDGEFGAVVAFYSIPHVPREQHATLFQTIAGWLRRGGVFVANINSRDEPVGYDADWLGAGPMFWSGFDGATNVALLADAGLTVIESAVVELTEPDGTSISPLWLVAQRTA